MRGTRRYIIAGAVGLFAIGIAAVVLGTQRRAAAVPGVPDTEDSRLIQETIYRSYDLQSEALLTADTSAFSEVFVNDPRGGPLLPGQIRRMQMATGECTKTDFGYLDFQTEIFTIRPAPQEAKCLADSGGALSGPRPVPWGVPAIVPAPAQLQFDSIAVEGDRAVAIVNNGSDLREEMLVKLDGKWLIAGEKLLSAWP